MFLSNIKTSTKVNVYNVLGALVKTAQLDADSSLDVNGGVYIVNAKSAEGEKSVKVIVP
ncbi:MAG: T9SS type A sorting domain-containing protein [Flavobacterium sp.]|nr:T9SS type A sorting domain-containing protein [Flavobacterium sp.]